MQVQPAHAPAIDVVAEFNGLTKPHKFSLNVTHSVTHAHPCLCAVKLSTGWLRRFEVTLRSAAPRLGAAADAARRRRLSVCWRDLQASPP
jgi:hypothetical protein